VPNDWPTGRIIPIHKKGERKQFSQASCCHLENVGKLKLGIEPSTFSAAAVNEFSNVAVHNAPTTEEFLFSTFLEK